MESPADHASKPGSDCGGSSPPPLPPPPDASQSLSQPSSDPPPVLENAGSDLITDLPIAAFGYDAPIPIDHDPYINDSDNKSTMDTVVDVLSRWSKTVGDTAKSAEDLSRNTWQHLKTGPSLVEAAMGRLAQGSKVLAEGGYEKVFRRSFDSCPEEQLRNSYACYLSTSAGPIMGVLYLSTLKLAFCSDNPLPCKDGDQTEWIYYKVVVPLHQMRSSNPSANTSNPAEKYIQVTTTDNNELWFMGFLNYESAVELLEEALLEVQMAEPN